MHPSRNTLNYISELNRFSLTGEENDVFQSPFPTTSLFNQMIAHSSSSTETSPDSFPDLTPHQFQPDLREEARKSGWNPQWRQGQYENKPEQFDSFRPETLDRPEHFDLRAFDSHMYEPNQSNLNYPEQIYETPQNVRRQRPIIGRKIMATETPLKPIDEFPIWQPATPPKSEKYTPNIYELFPSENRGFEFPSPVKTPHASPGIRTPRFSVSPNTPPPFSPRTPFKEPLIGPSSSFNFGSKMCTFCRKNGETQLVYMTHTVKEKVGNKNVVTCPILRSHVCSTCGASGDNAHTITYCPILRSGNNGQPLQSTTITLKNTRVKSNGRRRY